MVFNKDVIYLSTDTPHHRYLIKYFEKNNILFKKIFFETTSVKPSFKIVELCMNDGLLLFFFLFNNSSIRITPPLTISKEEIKKGCEIILRNLDKI